MDRGDPSGMPLLDRGARAPLCSRNAHKPTPEPGRAQETKFVEARERRRQVWSLHVIPKSRSAAHEAADKSFRPAARYFSTRTDSYLPKPCVARLA
jgi:hypothetical protein